MKISTVIADIIMIANRDHSDLQDLLADDHTQYHNDTRGDIRYYTKTLLDAGQLDTRYYTETELDTKLGVKVQIGGDLGGTITTPTVNDLTIASEATGDLLVKTVGGWVRLADVAVGQILKSGGVGVIPFWGNPSPVSFDMLENDLLAIPAYYSGAVIGTPEYANDGDTSTNVAFTTVNGEIVISITSLRKISQYRIYGSDTMAGDGYWKIQYLNSSGSWVDWKTSILTKGTAGWSAWDTSPSQVEAIAVKIIATTLDSSPYSILPEIEIKL